MAPTNIFRDFGIDMHDRSLFGAEPLRSHHVGQSDQRHPRKNQSILYSVTNKIESLLSGIDSRGPKSKGDMMFQRWRDWLQAVLLPPAVRLVLIPIRSRGR